MGDVSLREYLDSRIDATQKLLEVQLKDTKELLETKLEERDKATALGHAELERRLDGLNELREDVVKDRSQFVKMDVYAPAHEELRRQRQADNEKAIALAGSVQANTTDIASIKSSLTWLTRLIVGALILGLVGYVFQRLTGR